MYKDNLVAALQKAHQAGKCKERIIVVEDSDNIRGSDGCMKLSCELCSFSHKLFNSEPTAEKPHSTYESKNLNARMVMVALESGNSSPLFKFLVKILGLPCKFSKSTWERHVKKFKTAYESAANEVLLKSREKVCDLIPEDDESGLTPVKIGLDGTWAKRGFGSLFGAAFAVALEKNEIIDFGTKSKLNEAIAFAPMKKNSDKFKEHEAKVEENSESVFEDSSGAMEKEICKDIFNRSKEIGLQYTDLLGDGDSKDYNEVKGIYGMCDECKKYEEKTEEDKEKFDTSKMGLQFWQKHREKQIKCNRVNKIECINHVDKRCGTALRNLRNAWRGHKLPDGKAIGGNKNRLTEVNIKKLQVNYGKAIRSNVAPDVKTAKDHKDAVDKMRKAVMASLYHSIMLKDNKVRHQFCPSGDTSWCSSEGLVTWKMHLII